MPFARKLYASPPAPPVRPITRRVTYAGTTHQAAPKFDYLRSESRRRAVAALPCQHCGIEGQSQAAHSNSSTHGKGRGIKASDEYLAALCPRCHRMVDESYALSFVERSEIWQAAFLKTEALLMEHQHAQFAL